MEPRAWDEIDQFYREQWLMRMAFQLGADIAESAGTRHVFVDTEKFHLLIKQADRRKAAQLYQFEYEREARAWERRQ